jgi:hypothetical protein
MQLGGVRKLMMTNICHWYKPWALRYVFIKNVTKMNIGQFWLN